MGVLFLQNSRIQTYLTSLVTNEISKNLKAKISIENVSVTFVNRLLLKNLYIEDQNGDTLLFAPKINVVLRSYHRKKKELTISRLGLEEAYVNFIVDTSGVLNLKFILDELKSKEKTDSSQSSFQINNVQMKNSRFHYRRLGRNPVLKGIDFANMDMRNLNFDMENFVISGDTIVFSVKKMNLDEKSGFSVTEFHTDLSLSLRHMDFHEFSFKTPYSLIFAEYLDLSFFDFTDFSDFVNLVGINSNFYSSLLSFEDISYLSPSLSGYDENLRFSGKLKGQISNLKGTDIMLKFRENTYLKTNFTMIGLPDFKSTFMNYDITNFETNSEDLQQLKIPGGDNQRLLKIPRSIKELGTVKYSGKFTGYFDDFVAYGKFSTGLGEFSSDILLKPDTANTLYFQGNLKAKDFFLGKLINQDTLVGRITMNANINGYTSRKGIYAKMDGVIDSLQLNRYNYKNIDLSGALSNKIFDGAFSISDPNIKMEFLGKVNFSNENPEFAFTADVSRARPYYLHLGSSDPSYFASFLLETNFTGKTLDQINGEIRVVNSLFSKQDYQLQMYNLNLFAINTPDSNRIVINSDIIDGEVRGQYQLSSLAKSFKNLAQFYLPSLEEKEIDVFQPVDNNNFDFSFKLKNIHPLISFFLPKFDLGNNAEIFGHYHPGNKDIKLNATASMFSVNGNEWRDLSIKTQSDRQTIKTHASSSSMVLSNNKLIENLVLNTVVHSDTADIDLTWKSADKPLYKGNIIAKANLERNILTRNPIIVFDFDPTEIVFNDTLWRISESRVMIDSSSIAIDSFSLKNQNQHFLAYGTLSHDPDDALRFNLEKMDLTTLNIFTRKIKFDLAGNISGQASIKDPFKNMTFLSDLQMNELFINGEDIGTGALLANWNSGNKKIHISSFLGRGLVPGIKIEGDFTPQTKGLDFVIDLDKLKINMFQPFASFLVSDLKGIANGRLTLKGTSQKPDLNGEVRLMKTSMVVDYLKTRYNFSNDVKIEHNKIMIKDFEAFDEKGNKAIAQGYVNSKYFKEYSLDIRIVTDNFAFLNTTEKDNPLFYGKIFAGGIIRISGPTDNLQMDVTARSEKNSVFYIPLYTAEEVTVRNFIDWVDPMESETDLDENQVRYEVKMKGLKLNFNLEVTPDAEVQLVFDPKIGDIIKGRGTGNLKILINTVGKFEIYGDIDIEEGDYLFTLKNVINKKFVVEKGGRISWNGDPADANIDLQAKYSLKTTMGSLDPTQDQQTSKKRIPVECIINMSGKLMNPTIVTDIKLPGADQQTQNILKNSINTDEELTKQFVSLLVMNSFYSQQGFAQGGTAVTSSMVTSMELISNQLSSWLSQISNDFDVGINYRPGDQITNEELLVAFSTQILNDRIAISGNFDVGGNETGTSSATNTNNIVGDFDISYKITEKLHVKAFNRANDNLLFQTSPYTQGVGLFYREYFNNLKDLSARIFKPRLEAVEVKEPEGVVEE